MLFKKYKVTQVTVLSLTTLYIVEILLNLFLNFSLPYSHLNTANASIFSIIFPAFLHANEMHLFRNLTAFLLFMPIIEREIGSRKTFYLFIFSAIGGLIIYFIYGFIFNLTTSARGSSGASMFFIGIILVNICYIKLNSEIKSFGFVFVLLFIYEYLKIIFQTNIFSYGDTVLVAHLGGFTIGYVLYVLFRDYHIQDILNSYSYVLKTKFRHSNLNINAKILTSIIHFKK